MANTTFISAPLVGTGDDEDENINWQRGTVNSISGTLTPELGASENWDNDVTWAVTRKDNRYMNDHDAFVIDGTNGLAHYANYYVKSDLSGLYPPMELITGFGVGTYQNSTAGHGMYLRRVGISVYKNSTDSFLRWGSYARSRGSNNTSWRQLKYDFSESDRAAMAGYRFSHFIFQISSAGGSGTKTSEVHLGDFRLKWNLGDSSSTNRWVIGKHRNRIDAVSQAIQGK